MTLTTKLNQLTETCLEVSASNLPLLTQEAMSLAASESSFNGAYHRYVDDLSRFAGKMIKCGEIINHNPSWLDCVAAYLSSAQRQRQTLLKNQSFSAQFQEHVDGKPRIDDLVDSIGYLQQNPELRRQMIATRLRTMECKSQDLSLSPEEQRRVTEAERMMDKFSYSTSEPDLDLVNQFKRLQSNDWRYALRTFASLRL